MSEDMVDINMSITELKCFIYLNFGKYILNTTLKFPNISGRTVYHRLPDWDTHVHASKHDLSSNQYPRVRPDVSHNVRESLFGHVRRAKSQISLRIRAVWSKLSLFASWNFVPRLSKMYPVKSLIRLHEYSLIWIFTWCMSKGMLSGVETAVVEHHSALHHSADYI